MKLINWERWATLTILVTGYDPTNINIQNIVKYIISKAHKLAFK